MNENFNYGILSGDAVVYAPSYFADEYSVTMNPTPEMYAERGWKRIVDEKPDVEAGYMAVLSCYVEVNDVLSAVYEVKEAPEPVVQYSKLKLIQALKAHEKWQTAKQCISDFGIEDEWLACQYIRSDNAMFAATKNQVVQAGLVTAEELEQILREAVDEEL